MRAKYRSRKHDRPIHLAPVCTLLNPGRFRPRRCSLFLALNPELADLKKVKISYTPRLPELPPVPVNDRKNFDKEHEASLEPDKTEENKFLKYLDTLNIYKQKSADARSACKAWGAPDTSGTRKTD